MDGNVKDEKVGEGDARRVILEQAMDGISDVDFDPDRLEVCFVLLFPLLFVAFSHCDGWWCRPRYLRWKIDDHIVFYLVVNEENMHC